MISFSKTLSKKATKTSMVIDDDVYYASIGSGDAKYKDKISPSKLTFTQMDNIYYANVWVRAVVDRIVDRVCTIKPIIKPINSRLKGSKDIPDKTKKNIELVESWIENVNQNNESLSTVRKKVLRDILKYDAGAIEKVSGFEVKGKEDNPTVHLYAVAGDTIKLSPNNKGLLTGNAYRQVDYSMKEIASWTIDEMAYFIANPQSGRYYGNSPLESLHQTIVAELNASQYNSDFFTNNATPRISVSLKNMGIGQGTVAMKRFKEWWDKELEGKPHKPIILGSEQGEIDIKQISLSNDDMQFSQYMVWLLVKIMATYKMQPSIMGIMGKDSNPGDISEQFEQFKIDAIKPQLNLFKEKINPFVIMHKSGFNMDDVYLDFDFKVGDEKIQAEINERYLRSGVVTINDIRESIGLPRVYWGDVPYLQNNVAPFGVGPNGPALPTSNQNGNESVPNVETDSKKFIKNYIQQGKDYRGYPVGWNDIEEVDRLEILKKLLKQKENMINKYYMSFE